MPNYFTTSKKKDQFLKKGPDFSGQDSNVGVLRKKKMGYAKKKLKIKVLYRGKWYYASSIVIDKDGLLSIEYCHKLNGCVDSEHVDEIKIKVME